MAGQFVVERSEVISAGAEELFDHVGNLQAWDAWSPWAEMDPDMDKTYTGESGAVAAVEPNKRIAIDLKFLKPFKSENVTELMLEPGDGGTSVTWRMTGRETFMVKVMGLFGKNMDKMVGPDFEKGLGKLKRITES